MPRSLPGLSLTVGAVLAAMPLDRAEAQHLPEGGSSSCAELVYDGHTLTILQGGASCIIDWETFSIGEGYAVHFAQQPHWRALNRVTGGMFSHIAGTLTADGTIYITNPAGVFFADGAIVDAGAIYAAAGHMSDADFLAGTDRFTGLAGEIRNDGRIVADAVHLTGRRVVNAGLIRAVGGTATLTAAEDEVLLTEVGGRILVRVDGVDLHPDAPQAGGPAAGGDGIGVENRGHIDARDGQVVLGVGDMYALAIRNRGRIDARGGTAQLAAVSGTVETGGTSSAILTADTVDMSGDELHLNGRIHADVARFHDPVRVSGSAEVRGADGGMASAVLFGATVDGAEDGAGELEIDAALTAFGDDVGAAARLERLEVGGAVDAAGDLRSASGMELDGPLTLSGLETQTVDAGDGALAVGAVTKAGPGDAVLRSAATVEVDGGLTALGGDAIVDAPIAVVQGTATAMRDVTFTGDATVLGNVLAGDDAEFGGTSFVAGAVQAQDDVRFDGDATIGGGVFAGDDVRFRADAHVTGPIVAADDIRVDGDATVLGSVSAGDDARFFGDATVAGAISAADDVEVHGIGAIGASVLAGGDALINGSVGGDVSAGGDLDSTGALEVGGRMVVGGSAELGGDTVVGGDLTAGGSVVADGGLHVGGDLAAGGDIDVAGAARVLGDVHVGVDADFRDRAVIDGSVTAGDDLRFHGTARVRGDAIAGDDIRFELFGRVDGDVVAGDDIRFRDGARVLGSVWSGDDARFDGYARIDGALRADDDIELHAGGVVGGDIRSGDDIRAEGRLHVGGHVIADDNITLSGRTSMIGGGTQRIVSRGGETRVFATLDKRGSGSLVVRGDEGIVIDAPRIFAEGDLLLGQARSDSPAVATVTVLGSARLESGSGTLAFAGGERVTAFGDLELRGDRSVALSDTNVQGLLAVTAPRIDLRTRAASDVLLSDGGVVRDAGLDLSAGAFAFSTAPRLIGDDAVRFGSPRADADRLGTLDDHRLRVLDAFDATGWFLGGAVDGTVLDVFVQGSVATELAPAFDEREVIDPVRRDEPTKQLPRVLRDQDIARP